MKRARTCTHSLLEKFAKLESSFSEATGLLTVAEVRRLRPCLISCFLLNVCSSRSINNNNKKLRFAADRAGAIVVRMRAHRRRVRALCTTRRLCRAHVGEAIDRRHWQVADSARLWRLHELSRTSLNGAWILSAAGNRKNEFVFFCCVWRWLIDWLVVLFLFRFRWLMLGSSTIS